MDDELLTKLDRDHRKINKGDIVLLVYDIGSTLHSTRTIGTVLSTTFDEYRIQVYKVYWFGIGFTGEHYWYNISPVTLKEFEEGTLGYYGKHSER
jgi:hypothetical protein